MARRIQFLGIKLPMSHPVLAHVFGTLTKAERDALLAVESAGIGMVVMPGRTAFEIGPEQGFSKWYRFEGGNDYTQDMADSDAGRLFRGAIIEYEAFRDLGYPPHAKKVAEFPSLQLMSAMRLRDPQRNKTYNVDAQQAKTVQRLLRWASQYNAPSPTREEAGNTGNLSPVAVSMLLNSRGGRLR